MTVAHQECLLQTHMLIILNIETMPFLWFNTIKNERRELSRLKKYTRYIYTIEEIKNIVTPIAQSYGVDRVYLFGSYARGDAVWNSDLDFRIDSGKIRTLFDLGGFYSDLEEQLRKPIDIVTTDALSDDFNSEIKSEEVIIYE